MNAGSPADSGPSTADSCVLMHHRTGEDAAGPPVAAPTLGLMHPTRIGREGVCGAGRSIRPTMPNPPSDPLAGTDRLLIDGSNLLHAISRRTEPAPAATLIGRLRGAIPPEVGIELVLDGPPEPGMAGTRVAAGLIVRYSGRRSADHLLLTLVDDVRRTAIAPRDRRAAIDNLLVVTDDRELRQALSERGARTVGTRWLTARLERHRAASPTTGNRRPPTEPASTPPDDDDRPRWQPGRGATAKRGNPKRGRRPPG
jgi:hypothetical protein